MDRKENLIFILIESILSKFSRQNIRGFFLYQACFGCQFYVMSPADKKKNEITYFVTVEAFPSI